MNKEELIKEFREGCNADNISDPPTDTEWIETFWLSKLKAEREELLEEKKQLAKEMAEERVKAEIESYDKAKQDLLKKIEEMQYKVPLTNNQIKKIKQLLK